MTEALKPCPFCGSEAKITDAEPYAVECDNIFCLIDGPCHGSKSDAIEAWNSRAGSDTCLDGRAVAAAKLAYAETLNDDELGDERHVIRAYLTALPARPKAGSDQ